MIPPACLGDVSALAARFLLIAGLAAGHTPASEQLMVSGRAIQAQGRYADAENTLSTVDNPARFEVDWRYLQREK